MFFEAPGPCGVCGAPHASCKPDGDTSEGVGVTRGLIVVPRNEPSRVVVPVVQTGHLMTPRKDVADAPAQPVPPPPTTKGRKTRA